MYGLNITSCSLIPNFFAFKHPLLHIFLRTSDSFSSLKITLNVSKTRSTQRRPRTYYTILWFIRATIFVVERQQCVPFVLLKHIRRCQQSNKYLKRCHGSTTMRSPYCCASNNTKHAQVFMQNGRCFCPIFNRILNVLTDFVVVANTKFHENPSIDSRTTISSQTAVQSRS